MLDRVSDARRAAVFYAIALGLAILASLAAPVLHEGALILTMFTPLAAVLLMMLVFTHEGRSSAGWAALGLTKPGWRGWPLAVLAPIVVLGVSYAILWATPYAEYQPLGDARPVVAIVIFTAIGLLIDIVMAFGEEVGWRGFMLPRLMWLGAVPAMLVVGLLHGVWHLPLIFLTPYYHADGNLMIVVPLFLVTLSLGGVFFGYRAHGERVAGRHRPRGPQRRLGVIGAAHHRVVGRDHRVPRWRERRHRDRWPCGARRRVGVAAARTRGRRGVSFSQPPTRTRFPAGSTVSMPPSASLTGAPAASSRLRVAARSAPTAPR